MKVCLKGNKAQLLYTPCTVRFPGDQIDREDDRLRIVCEGYVLNSARLLSEHPGMSLSDLVARLYEAEGFASVLMTLRGSYVLGIHDKEKQLLWLGNDMLSKKPLFYLKSEDGLLADTSFLSLAECAKAAGLPLTPDAAAARQMLERCSFLDGDTYVKEIRFLEGMRCIRCGVGDGSISVEDYRPELPLPKDGDGLLGQIDDLFTEACRMAVEKNRREGYRQVFTLSAGMDSRCAYLKSLPHCTEEEKPLCLTYGAAGCMELTIAKQLADKHGSELIAREIEPVSFIPQRDEILDRNEGMMYYAGTTGLNPLLNTLDTSAFGLVITGLGGGEIMGDLCRAYTCKEEENALYCELFGGLLPAGEAAQRTAALQQRYGDYNRYICMQDIRTCHNFAYTGRMHFETFSPFLYEDLFLLLLQVPQSRKSYRRLYAQWYLKYIGDTTPTSCFQGPVRITSRTAPDQLLKGVFRRLRRMLGIQSRWDMNPMTRWVEDYPENRRFMDAALENDLSLIRPKEPELAAQLQADYRAADADRKLRVLTLTGMLGRLLK